MFELKNFYVFANDKEILKDINLNIKEKEIIAIMGPNGSGKSTLCKAIMGHPAYKTKGKILLQGKDLSKATTDERAKAGIFLSFQEPPEIKGVPIMKLIARVKKTKISEAKKELLQISKEYSIDESLIKRNINEKFSGGEKKRAELIQMLSLKPKLALLDEIDSGMDADGLKEIAKAVKRLTENKSSAIIISHQTKLFKYLDVNSVYIMKNGKIAKKGSFELADKIEKEGYKWI